ncbi:MAG: hypothetical protein WBO97_06735, partial [Tepidiformaceae bacterium]
LTAGFNAKGWELQPSDEDGLGGTASFYFSPNGCYTEAPALAAKVANLVRQALSIIAEVPQGEPLCTITFTNTDDENRLPSGNLRIEKYLDINGDGDANDAGEGLIAWTVNVNGPEALVNGSHYMAGGTVDFAGLTTGDVYNVNENGQPGYTITNATVNGISQGAVTATSATIPEGGTTVVRFYNQPLGGILVHKDTYNVLDGKETQNLNDDDGWTITVDSTACKVHESKNTDASGNASFSGLPLCNDYVVSENTTNPTAPGYSPVTPASVSNVTPTIGGFTAIKFVNETRKSTPPCIDCNGNTPTPTPVTPTQTPVVPTATPTTPANTATPVPPTATPTTPVSGVQGEKTPGPGKTPIAPSTGNGLMGGGAAGMNLLFLLAGLVAVAIGSGFVALGRKR